MTVYVRICPACASARPLAEADCENLVEGGTPCGFPLVEVNAVAMPGDAEPEQAPPHEPHPVENPGEISAPPPADAATGPFCPNGHTVEAGDILCMVCGALVPQDAGESEGGSPDRAAEPEPAVHTIGDWAILAALPNATEDTDLYLVRRADDDATAVLRHFRRGVEPDPALYAVFQRLARPDIARLMDHGRVDARAFEVWEHVQGQTLGELRQRLSGQPDTLEQVAIALIKTLAAFERNGLRHGNLQPVVIRLRTEQPLAFCITDFASARIAEFDVEISRFRQTSRYMAPEAVVEASTPASDWWSLGIILLELLTDGGCFEGVHERAFLLHLVSRDVALPEALSPRWANLLAGLLTRNHDRRWTADTALRWADGEVDIPTYREASRPAAPGPVLHFADRKITESAEFAFLAAEEAHWAEAQSALDMGRIAGWLESFDKPGKTLSLIKKLAADQPLKQLHADLPLALVLAALNPNLPLCVRSAILTPRALLADPDLGVQWLSRPVISYLRALNRPSDQWLIALADRADRVRSRAKQANITLDETDFRVLQLVTSITVLENRWAKKRRLFPESKSTLLDSLIERHSITDEDLLLLTAARITHFSPAEEVLRDAEKLAQIAEVPEFDRQAAEQALALSRRELAEQLADRVPGFERCGRETVDLWLETYRLAARRMPLARLLVALAVPVLDWAPPRHQDYVERVLEDMRKRVVCGIQKGPLVQMRPTERAIDLTAIGKAPLQAQILDAVIARANDPVPLPRSALSADLIEKLRKLDSKGRAYKRDTGLDALYLAFPIVALKSTAAAGREKTRIAPVVLWPVVLTIQAGAAGSVALAFDPSREAQLNPALDSILGAEPMARWQEWAQEALRPGLTDHNAVLRAVCDLAGCREPDSLAPLPKASAMEANNTLAIYASGAVFVAEYPSQAIANDLRLLQQKPLEGTALEHVLRLRADQPPADPGEVPHSQRFVTLEADPSQEQAVLRARHQPGLVVQGPPGTGKSQTIVNIITDCMGRGESVLVVCEKKAALDVVQKRLTAEKLDHRVFRVESTENDRKVILKALQAQVPALFDQRGTPAHKVVAPRLQTASELDALCNQLNAYHEALYQPDPRLGLSYRETLAAIAGHDAEAGGLSAPGLRALLGTATAEQLETTISACVGLIDVWLESVGEAHDLAIFAPMPTDAALASRIAADLAALEVADRERLAARSAKAALPGTLADLSSSDPAALGSWLEEHGPAMCALSAEDVARAGGWRRFFAPNAPLAAAAREHCGRLERLTQTLDRLGLSGSAARVHDAVRAWTDAERARLARAFPALVPAPGAFAFLNPRGLWQRQQARSALTARGVDPDRGALVAHAEAAQYEQTIRALSAEFYEISAFFGDPVADFAARAEVLAAAKALSQRLGAVQRLAERLATAPMAELWGHDLVPYDLWPHVERLGSHPNASLNAHPLSDLVGALHAARRCALADEDTLARAKSVAPYLTDGTQDAIARAVRIGSTLPFDWATMRGGLPALVAYQAFRARAAALDTTARAVFAELSLIAEPIRATANPRAAIAALMRREAATAWQGAMAQAVPELQRMRSQWDEERSRLERLDGKLRDLNRQMLGHVAADAIGPQQDWSRIWMLTGNNSQRLRQVFEKGRALGLLKLRPVWLVNPDVASRMLPLEAGLFDVVIFDEASQMRVVNALPSLYRAKRAIISGDDKQLPPTSFFGTAAESTPAVDEDDDPWAQLDEDTTDDGADAEAGVIDPRELAANERHIRDCEDLLTLAAAIMPAASLDIHYRSAYRELIAFSNAAYYGGKLNVPVVRPVADVARAKPIEVRRIDGLYKNQTNASEAEAIVDLLAELWQTHAEPPTVGVVSFNMKQADLIESRLQARADGDRAFSRALDRERKRTASGEDVGFFVKNLENVQGDERDWIVFSTTFGPDEDGVFKRVFGALNQQGGERRLNVAVTRAKNKVVLVTSMPTAKISDFIGQRRPPTMARDYLQGYMRYAELIHDGDLEAAAAILNAFGSTANAPGPSAEIATDPLVSQAYQALTEAGFTATQLPAGDAFGFDLAVTHPKTGLYALGVEFDSPRHPLLTDARAREVWRPKVLERAGVRLYPIPSSAWVQDPAKERERLIMAARLATHEEPTE